MNERLDRGFDVLANGQIEEASGIGLQVMQFGRKTNNPQLYAQSCLLLSEVALRSGTWSEGVKFASRAMESVRDMDEFLWCNLGVAMVDIYYNYGVFEKAIGLSQKIFDKGQLTRDQELRLLQTWTRALLSIDESKSAESLLNKYFESKQADFHKNPIPYMELFELWLDAKATNAKYNEAYLQVINLISIVDKDASQEKLLMLLNKAGELCIHIKEYNKAISFFNEANQISESRWPNQENYILLNLARAYYKSGNYARSFDIAEKSYLSAEKQNHTFQKAISAAFIARLKVSTNSITSAIDWAILALRMSEELNDLPLQSQVAFLLSELFTLNNEFERSAKYKLKADQINEKLILARQNEKLKRANLNAEIANVEFEAIMELQNFEKQRLLLNDKLKKIQFESERQQERYRFELQLANENIEKERVLNRIQNLEAEKLSQAQRFQISELENKRKSSLLSISELTIQKQDIANKNLSLKLKNDNLAAQDELNKKEIEFRKKQSIFGILFTGVLLLVLLIIVFFFRKTRSQNKIIEQNNKEIQAINHELGEKNNEIVSGIQYASKFQEMVYPKESDLKKYFQDGFIIHRPLEMVSGDLPFVFNVNNNIYIAAVDCIGHGVSASMLSIMTYFGLTDIIRNNPNENCARVLKLLHQRLVLRLSQRESRNYIVSVDISIVKIDLDSRKMQFAGANLPLLLLRNGEVSIFKGVHISIGEDVSDDRLEFNNFDYQCLVGDELYLFSDGLFHQFGGLEGKQKLSKKRIIKRLDEVHQTSFAERKAQLNKLFDDWKGESPQTDDLVILGIKV
jgi:serine phosphatase RsbU (regulator of sigma subunit)